MLDLSLKVEAPLAYSRCRLRQAQLQVLIPVASGKYQSGFPKSLLQARPDNPCAVPFLARLP
jgi:hypothetical protein